MKEQENKSIKNEIKKETEEYFKSHSVSHSLLSMLSNPKWIEWRIKNIEVDDGDKKHFRIGSAIDCLITEPHKFNDLFHVSNLNNPSGLMGKFIYYLPQGIEKIKEVEDMTESDLEVYKVAWEKAEYKTPLKTVVKNFWANAEYYTFYFTSKNTVNKTVLSQDEYKDVEAAVENINANVYIRKYFSRITPEGIVREFQKTILWNHIYSKELDIFDTPVTKEIGCKAILDLLEWDHEQKTVRGIDLKSTGHSTYDFKDSFYEYGYFRQAAFYYLAISALLKQLNKEDYTILPFQFIVTPKSNKGYPALIYEVSQDSLAKGFTGFIHNDKKYTGVTELIDDFIWHREHGEWNAQRKVIESQYKLII